MSNRKQGPTKATDEDKDMIDTTTSRSAIMEENSHQKASGSPSARMLTPSERFVLRENLCKLKLPFPWKLHQLLDDVEYAGFEDIVSWLPGGHAFRVHKPDVFSKKIMTKYFRQTKFSSFTRQLYIYGFTKIEGGDHHGGYFHPRFVREDKSASMTLTRNSHRDRRLKHNPEGGGGAASLFLPGTTGSNNERSEEEGHSYRSIWGDYKEQATAATPTAALSSSSGDVETPVYSSGRPSSASAAAASMEFQSTLPAATHHPASGAFSQMPLATWSGTRGHEMSSSQGIGEATSLLAMYRQEEQLRNSLLPPLPLPHYGHRRQQYYEAKTPEGWRQNLAASPSSFGTEADYYNPRASLGLSTGSTNMSSHAAALLDHISRLPRGPLEPSAPSSSSNEAASSSLFSIEPRSIEEIMNNDTAWGKSPEAPDDSANNR